MTMIAAPSSRVIISLIAAFGIISILAFQYQPFNYFSLASTGKTSASSSHARWLIATECAAKSQTRRNVIRATWQTLYRDPRFKMRFILSDYDPLWEGLIHEENATYGDIIKLEGLDPSPKISNRIKFMELLKYLVSRGETYSWVSKVDDDAFLEAKRFYDQYLEGQPEENLTLISMKNRHEAGFDWPGGAFYTVSWKLVERLTKIHSGQQDLETPEDVRVGMYLHDGKVQYDYKEMPREEMFEIPVKKARIPHKITKAAILIHFLKDHDTFLQVSHLFGKEGYNGEALNEWTG